MSAAALALEALKNIKQTLEDANDMPGGPIADTIWYSPSETLFDYVDASISSLEAEAVQPVAWIDSDGCIVIPLSLEYSFVDANRAIPDSWRPLGYATPQQPAVQKIAEFGELQNAIEEIEKLKLLIRKTHEAKGRYHSQIAMCDLYDSMGLLNVRPKP